MYVSNGVNYQAFSTPALEPDDMRDIPRPRIGYVGILKDQLDLPLLADVVRQRPEWSFVFVGPRRNVAASAPVLAELETRRNVFFLGEKRVQELPAYTQHLDVGTLCYHVDGYTKYINPLKLNEYLAAGRPVVGVPLPSIEPFGDVVRIARTVPEWCDAIAACLDAAENSLERIATRQAVARRLDWSHQVHLIATAMHGRAYERE
jgi:glycosyltransferase involved in cell wall biosynthesis